MKNKNEVTASKLKIKIIENEIHLWSIDPTHITSECLIEKYKDLLTEDEVIKQQKYRFDKDKHSALITRAFVRDLLSYYADVKPNDWRFSKGEKDKPEIIDPPLPLRFNISHTDKLIICAVMLNDDIGCDVENINRNTDPLLIAERFFSPSEVAELFALSENKQRSRFFDYWTLKESYIKAWGLGLSIPLADFSFNISSSQNEQLNNNIKLSFAQHRQDVPQIWRSWLIYPNESHRIAISVRAKKNNQDVDYQLKFFSSLPLIGYKEINIGKDV